MVAEAVTEPEVNTLQAIEFDSVVEVRNLSKRELDIRLVPWGVIAETTNGREMFERGAFADADPTSVLLFGLEHEVHLGLGQSGQPVMTRHPVGKAIALDDREDGQYATFRVAKTARGDEVLELASEGIAAGASVEFMQLPGGTQTRTERGRRLSVHTRAHLAGASTTYRPTWHEAGVVAVRTKKESVVMAEATPEPVQAPAPPQMDTSAILEGINRAIASQDERFAKTLESVQARAAQPDDRMEKMLERLEGLEEQARASFSIPVGPSAASHPDDFTRGDWLKLVLRTLSGEVMSQSELQARVAAELVTADNLGVVPEAFLPEMIGIIDPARPFLQSTTQLRTPSAGVQLTVPVLATRPTVGVQAAEKDELASTTTSITDTSFSPTTIGGYGDISLQLLKRSDPSYLELYTELLAEAYAIMADDKAVDALLAVAAVVEGGVMDPDSGAQFGSAWTNGAAVSRRLVPDTLWLSSTAVAAFIDAKSDTTNAPLYSNLAAAFTAAGGAGGTVSGLRPVHVPALDDEAVDMIVGPRRGFAWAEDGTYTLQVDVPAKAGRDVGIVGMIWYAPLYPAAFTTYTLAS